MHAHHTQQNPILLLAYSSYYLVLFTHPDPGSRLKSWLRRARQHAKQSHHDYGSIGYLVYGKHIYYTTYPHSVCFFGINDIYQPSEAPHRMTDLARVQRRRPRPCYVFFLLICGPIQKLNGRLLTYNCRSEENLLLHLKSKPIDISHRDNPSMISSSKKGPNRTIANGRHRIILVAIYTSRGPIQGPTSSF